MGSFRRPKQRLPAHLQHLRRNSAGSEALPSATPQPTPSSLPPVTPEGSERLSELLPSILRAMVGHQAELEAPVVIGQPDILAALAPYYRPKSRFEGLMMRKLVGEGYLKPRGARDKSGLSGAYELTPRGQALLRGER